MREIPILFSTPMVKALIEGRKVQTRRIVKPQPNPCNHSIYTEADWKNEPTEFISDKDNHWYCRFCGNGTNPLGIGFKCPYGQIGDFIYVRETFVFRDKHNQYYYKADYPEFEPYAHNGWKPSIHMPKEAARIWLEITGVSVERLQEISEQDAIAEGVESNDTFYRHYLDKNPACFVIDNAKDSYETLWQSINGIQGWNSNPFIWKISFKVLSTTGKPQHLEIKNSL